MIKTKLEKMNKAKFTLSYHTRKKMKLITSKTIVYLFLSIFGFLLVFPLFQALSTSFKSLSDISDPTVNYIPKSLTLQNYQTIFESMNIWESLFFSVVYAGGSALLQTISCAFVAYGLARYEFKFKKLIFVLIMLVFLIPPQTLMTPSFVLMGTLNLNDSLLAFFLPAILGQGIKSTIFILIFYSFFKAIPEDIYESAALEGAKPLDIFVKITLPLVRGAMVITFLLSFVWYFNDTYFADLYYRGINTLPLKVASIISGILAKDPNKLIDVPIYDGLMSAGIIILIIPLIIFYFILQKQFKQGIENTGMTGQ